jgi:hypothetical protein
MYGTVPVSPPVLSSVTPPMVACASVSTVSSRTSLRKRRAKPKSRTFTSPSGVTMTLELFKSR